MSAPTIIVTGTYERRLGGPASGSVVFAPIVARTVDGAGDVIVGTRTYATLDTDGHISATLVSDVNGYTVLERIDGADDVTYEIPGNADIDLQAAPQPLPQPPGIVFDITTTTTYQASIGDIGRTGITLSDTEVAYALPDEATSAIPIGSRGDVIQGGAGAIRIATIGAAVVHYTDDDTVPVFRTRTKYSPLTWFKRAANEFWIAGDMLLP